MTPSAIMATTGQASTDKSGPTDPSVTKSHPVAIPASDDAERFKRKSPEARRMSGVRLANAPARPSAQAESDAALLRLWLHEKSEHTRRAYQKDVDEFLGFLTQAVGPFAKLGAAPLQAITLEHVLNYKEHLLHTRMREDASEKRDDPTGETGKPAPAPISKSTAARKIACVKSLLTFAFEIGYVRMNVGQAMKQPPIRRRLSEKLLSREEIEALFAAARRSIFPVRNAAILQLFYSGGLRRSELAALRWRDFAARSDLSPARGQVSVWGKGEKERTVLVTPRTWAQLQALRAEESATGRAGTADPVFWSQKGGALSESGVYRVVRKAAKAAGITGKNVSPHSFRHALITHALSAGAPLHVVTATAGHSSMAVTSVYAHAHPDESASDYL